MARLPRRHQKVFAENATNNGVFGSLQAGNPTKSNDLAVIQSLDAYSEGWLSATSGSANLPPLEEFQALQYLASKQLCYLFQEGIAEWNADCTYYIGSIAKIIDGTNFRIYCSITDDNKGNLTSDTSHWKLWFDSTSYYALETQLNDYVLKTQLSTTLSTIYPVGSIYIGTQSTCPMASLISGSTWTKIEGGRALWISDSSHSANTTISAGLPNITGETIVSNSGMMNIHKIGAFSSSGTGYGTARHGGTSDGNYHDVPGYLNFNAQNSNSIYGNSTTVQPPAYVVNVWRRTK